MNHLCVVVCTSCRKRRGTDCSRAELPHASLILCHRFHRQPVSCLMEDKIKVGHEEKVWSQCPGRHISTSKTLWFACMCAVAVLSRRGCYQQLRNIPKASALICIQIPCELTGGIPVCQAVVCLVLEQPLPLELLTAPTAFVPVGGGMNAWHLAQVYLEQLLAGFWVQRVPLPTENSFSTSSAYLTFLVNTLLTDISLALCNHPYRVGIYNSYLRCMRLI